MPLWYLTVSTIIVVAAAVAVIIAITALADVADLRRDLDHERSEVSKLCAEQLDLRSRWVPLSEERRAAVRWQSLYKEFR